MKTYDAVVIGAGLAGLQCGRLLGRRGFAVLLADAKPSVDRSIHTTGIFVRRTLLDFDIPDDCLGPAVRHVTLYSPAGRALPLESPHDEFRVGRMGPLYLRWLADCREAGVEWAPETRFAGLEMDGPESVVHLEGPRGPVAVRARFVVGADGATSRVARALELDENTEWIVGVEDVLRGVDAGGPPCFHCFLDPEVAPGYIAWLVSDGEEAHLGVGGYARHFQPLDALRRFRAMAERRFGLKGAETVERRGGRIPVGGVLRRIANRRGLLTGDAAGAVSPLTAGGLDPCLRLSALAAHVAGDFLETGDEAALAPYCGDRFRAHFRTRIAMRRAIAAVRSPLLLEMACAALRSPLLRPLAGGVFFGRGSFPDVDPGPRRLVHRPGDGGRTVRAASTERPAVHLPEAVEAEVAP
ncbi:MAG TPA: NAD(P)/FAD-dependent oxidoreductase [Longimicrobiaceae bacterium]|nr:NAD(P)/FAD-dependent oxidoreductase [Longimicrobiaceae bacterium]